MFKFLRLTAFCFLFFAFEANAQVQSSLENCGGYSVLSLKNEGTSSQSVSVPLNGKTETLTIAPNAVKLFKIKEETLRINGQSIVGKTSQAALCFSSQMDTQYYLSKPNPTVTLGGGGNSPTSDPICGDGVVGSGEQCDLGTANGTCGGSCKSDCRIAGIIPTCGNNIVENACSEHCDDGNTSGGDGCSATCTYESVCGDGTVEGFEQCDDGNTNSCDTCRNCRTQTAIVPVCGNGIVNTTCGGTETCDDANTANGDGCSSTCQTECGNGIVNGQEECDDGNSLPNDTCTNCKANICGNNRLDYGEGCDDGNTVNGDGCSSSCFVECGNGVINAPGEQCDGGANCDSQCFTIACGNGRLQGTEECDDGNSNNNDSCSNSCILAINYALFKRAYLNLEPPPYGTTYQPLPNDTRLLMGTIVRFEVEVRVYGTVAPNSTITVKDVFPAGITLLNQAGTPYVHPAGYNVGTGEVTLNTNSFLNYFGEGYKKFILHFYGSLNFAATNCAQVSASTLTDINSTPNNLVGINAIEDDEACVTLNTTFGCTTPFENFETAPYGSMQYLYNSTPTTYMGSNGRYYPSHEVKITDLIRTAYPTNPLAAHEGITLITSGGDPYDGSKFIRLQGNGYCLGTTSTYSGSVFNNTDGMKRLACVAVAAENNVATPFVIEAAGVPNFNAFAFPSTSWTDLNWHNYCVPMATANNNFLGDWLVTNTDTAGSPITVDGLCLMKEEAFCNNPTTTITPTSPTCSSNGVPNNDGFVTLGGVYNKTYSYAYNVGNTFNYGNTSIPLTSNKITGLAAGTYTFRFFDQSCSVTRTVTIAPTTCTAPCSLTASPTAIACNNNSTTNTGADDRITFSVNPTKTGGTASTSYNVTVGGTTIAPTSGTYGSSTNFTLGTGSAGTGNKTVTLTDANNATCSTTVNLTDPGTCSIPGCSLNQPTTSVTCDGKGTPDTSDDTYSYNITVTGSDTSMTYGITGGDTQSGLSYGTSQGAFGNFLISSGGKTLNITDATSSSCTTTATLTAPATCSPTTPSCSLNTPTTSATCNDNRTPNDPSDDTFSYNITVNGTNTGAAYDISGGDSQSGLSYGTQQGAFGTFPISGGDLSLKIEDVSNAVCRTTATVTAPASCSSTPVCSMNDPVVVAYCNTNGTPSGADDSFGYAITASGTGVSTLYDVMGDDIRNDQPYNVENGPYGWYPLSQGALVLNVIDNVDTGCSAAAVVIAPDDCTFCTHPSGICIDDDPAGTCTLTAPDVAGICNDNGTPSNPADDTFTYSVNVTHTGTDPTALYNISGGDTRTNLTANSLQGPFGTFPISGGNLTLTTTDADNPSCTDGFTVTAPATCSGTMMIDNCAEVIASDQNDPDSTPNDGIGDEHSCVTITKTTMPVFDLALDKKLASGQASTVAPGDLVNFVITVYNQGTVAASNVQVTDHPDLSRYEALAAADNPSGTTTGTATLPYSWNVGTRTISTTGTLGIGQSMQIPVRLRVLAGATGVAVNKAEISAATGGTDIDSIPDGTDGNQTGEQSPNLEDDQINENGTSGMDEDDHDPAQVTVTTSPICSLNPPVTQPTCNDNGTANDPGDDYYTYTINVSGTNTGTGYNVSGSDSRTGLAYNGVRGPFGNAGQFAIGTNLNLTVTDATTSSCTTTGTVTSPAACSVAPPVCSLGTPVMSSVCNDNGTPTNPTDDTFSYQILLTGSNTGTNYEINEAGGTVRTGVAYGVLAGAYGPFPVSGGSILLTMVDGSDASCTVQSFAPAPAVCSGPATPADLRLTKTVDRGTYLLGQQLVFTITVFNDGPGSAMGVVVRDALPAGVSLVSAVPSVGTYNSATGQWLVGDMTANTSQTLTITVTVVSTP